jgi:serine/threonine protein kinase
MRTDPLVGRTVAGYRLVELIGRGGMGVVYRAEQLSLGRDVAFKLLREDLAHDDAFRTRFLRESRLGGQVPHPNLVPIYDAGEADGLLYIAMQHVDGVDLRRLVAREGRLAPARALAILTPVARALDAAHARGLVHRDVKPANILVVEHATGGVDAYLSDFGLLKRISSQTGLTQAGKLVGTTAYVAPEQIQGQPVSGAADQYALACVLFECLTGSMPFPREEEAAVLRAHCRRRRRRWPTTVPSCRPRWARCSPAPWPSSRPNGSGAATRSWTPLAAPSAAPPPPTRRPWSAGPPPPPAGPRPPPGDPRAGRTTSRPTPPPCRCRHRRRPGAPRPADRPPALAGTGWWRCSPSSACC